MLRDETVLALVAIVSLVVILVACLHYGHDHVIIAVIVSVIAGLGGYEIRIWKEKR